MKALSLMGATEIPIEFTRHFTDNERMLSQLIHFLMIATVLVCPALGGLCCDEVDFDSVTQSQVGETCVACSCHDAEPCNPVSPSQHSECPGECHDCFCAGALPVGPSALDSLSIGSASFDFVVLTPAKTLVSLNRASLQLEACQWPLTTGERLATLCTLLI